MTIVPFIEYTFNLSFNVNQSLGILNQDTPYPLLSQYQTLFVESGQTKTRRCNKNIIEVLLQNHQKFLAFVLSC